MRMNSDRRIAARGNDPVLATHVDEGKRTEEQGDDDDDDNDDDDDE